MKIFKGAIKINAERGYKSLQVPDVCIGKPLEEVEAPDEWFFYMKDGRVACGRESGFLHLSRQGFEANKEILKKALEGNERGTTWEDFEAAAEAELTRCEKDTKKFISQMEAKIEQSKKVLKDKIEKPSANEI